MENKKKIIMIIEGVVAVSVIAGLAIYATSRPQNNQAQFNPNQMNQENANNQNQLAIDGAPTATSSSANVIAVNSPEDVYVKFRQAMLDGDIEKAVNYIVSDRRDLYRNAFSNPETLTAYQRMCDVSLIERHEIEVAEGKLPYLYFMDEKKEQPYFLLFNMNDKGEWEIESI